jgi:hypothetical protein
MPYGLTTLGREYILSDYAGRGIVFMTLYNDDTDALSNDATVSDITTEPTGSNYVRPEVTSGDVSTIVTDSGGVELTIGAQPFDVSDSTVNVDSFALIDGTGNVQLRGPIDTSDRSTDYINLDQNTNLLLGGEPLELLS